MWRGMSVSCLSFQLYQERKTADGIGGEVMMAVREKWHDMDILFILHFLQFT